MAGMLPVTTDDCGESLQTEPVRAVGLYVHGGMRRFGTRCAARAEARGSLEAGGTHETQDHARSCGVLVSLLAALVVACVPVNALAQQMHVGFLWHMHQPIYYPYETIIETEAAGHFSFSVIDVHNQRFGPYTTWPLDAIQAGLALSHLGAQVSFSGSLIENLSNLEAAGVNGGMWNNWDAGYDQGQSLLTSLGNRRLEMVAFGYHHPVMALLDEEDLRMQIKLHKHVHAQTWYGGSTYSAGMFPPETAFSQRMIPALVAEGID